MTKKRVVLIDGDVYIFRAALSAEHAVEWTEDLWTLHANMSDAISYFENSISEIKEELEADDVIIALSDKTNFRYSILPTYKSNRKDKRPPLLRARLKEWVQVAYNTYMRPQLEGDDVLGILATSKVIVKNAEKVVVSIDKDMKTIPCTYYNTDKKEYKVTTECEADYNHLIQTLTGDAADGYSGCPGVGPKTAEKLLVDMDCYNHDNKPFSHWWDVVVKAYGKAGLTEEDALTQARVARICRNSDYDFKRREVIPWTPQTE